MSAWILIIMITSGTPDRVDMQEFGNKEACERALQVVQRKVYRANIACVPKF